MRNTYVKFILLPLSVLGLLGIWDFCAEPRLYKIALMGMGWFVIGCLGMEIGIHRLISHRAFECDRWLQNTLSVLGCMGAQWSPMQWAALHVGIHHRLSDEPGDIHSPKRGLWNSYLGWYFSIRAEDINVCRVRWLLGDPFQVFLHRHYLLIFWGILSFITLINPLIVLYELAIPAFLTIHQTNLSNLFCHIPSLGYRNFPTKDNSVNILWWSPFSYGLALHNNHHADAKNWNFSVRSKEWDPSASVLWLLYRLGLIELKIEEEQLTYGSE